MGQGQGQHEQPMCLEDHIKTRAMFSKAWEPHPKFGQLLRRASAKHSNEFARANGKDDNMIRHYHGLLNEQVFKNSRQRRPPLFADALGPRAFVRSFVPDALVFLRAAGVCARTP